MKKNISHGFTLVEVLVSVLIAGFLGMVVAGVSVFALKNERQVRTLSQIDLFRGVLVSTIQGGKSWDKTLALNPPTAKFDCLSSTTNYCTDTGTATGTVLGETLFAVYDAAGTLVYDSTVPTNGITPDGALCANFNAAPGSGNDDCPFRFELTWKPVCENGAQCKTPPIKVAAKLKYNGKAGSSQLVANSQAYSISGFYRNPTSSGPGGGGGGPGGNVVPGTSSPVSGPGCVAYTIPPYNSLKVELWGGGGAGGNFGQNGEASSFGPIVAGGGRGYFIPGDPPGAGGVAVGGDVNLNGSSGGDYSGGSSPNGGSGGYNSAGSSPGGGGGRGGRGLGIYGGGGGAYAMKVFNAGDLAVGSTISVCRGAGGRGSNGANILGGNGGYSGANGNVIITIQ